MRLVQVVERYTIAAHTLAPGGTPLGRKVARTIAQMRNAKTLPGPADNHKLLYDEQRHRSVFTDIRRVPGCNLWIAYTATAELITLHALTDVPP